MDWFRWYHGTTTDPKWRLVARRSGQRVTDVIAVWAMVLEAASEADERGTIDGLDTEVVAAALDLEPDQVQAILDAMQGRVLDGTRVSAWEKRQPKREDDSSDRVRRYRERKRTEAIATSHDATDVTQCNATETHGNAPDRDTDTERDINTSSSPSTRAQAREADLDRLRAYLGEHAGAVDRFAVSADHSPTWAAGILGLYGPQGTDPTIWQRSPPEVRPALLARALDRYASEGKSYNGRLFRRFLEAVVDEHTSSGRASGGDRGRPAPQNGRGPAPARPAAEPVGGDPSRRGRWVYE